MEAVEETQHEPQVPAKPQPKKRARLPSSCVVCRKRKVRCNKARPSCDQCLAARVGYLCQYDDPTWLSKVTDGSGPKSPVTVVETPSTQTSTDAPTEKVDELLRRVKQLEATMRDNEGSSVTTEPAILGYNPTERVQFLDRLPFLVPSVMRKSKIEFHGSMSPIFDIKTDPYLKIIWLNMWRYLDTAMQSRFGNGQTVNPINFSTTALNEVVLKFLDLRRQKVAFKLMCEKKLNNPSQRLNEILLHNLPEKKTIMCLLEIFFAKLYTLLPFVNKDKLIEELDEIFGDWNDLNNKPSVIHIKSRHDIAVMAMLFALMAVSCLTLNDSDLDDIESLGPLKQMRPAIFSEVAQCCLEHERTLRKSTYVRTANAMMILKFYNDHCPENDTMSDLSGGKILTGLIVTLARSNGCFADLSIAEEFSHVDLSQYYRTLRRFWHSLMSLDATESVISGTLPRFTDDLGYDTELPDHEVGEPSLETAIISDYEYLDRQTRLFRKLCFALFQRRDDPTLEKLLSLIDEVKRFTEREFGSLLNVLERNADPCISLKQVCYLLDLYVIEIGLRQRVIAHFHQTENLKMIHEHFGIQLSLVTKTYHAVMNVAYSIDKYFGKSYHVILRPKLVYAATKIILILGTLIGRCAQALTRLSISEQPRLRALRELKERSTNAMTRCLELFLKMNHGYYNAQKASIGFSFFVTMLQDPAFDFDKAQRDVTRRTDVSDEIKAYYFQVLDGQDVSKTTNLLDDLLTAELEFMATVLPGPISEIVQPHFGKFGQYVYVNPKQPLFHKELVCLSNHFSLPDGVTTTTTTRELNDDAEMSIQRAMSMKYLNHKVDTIFAGSDTIKASGVMSPAQLAGFASLKSEHQGKERENGEQVTVTSDEFGNIFGLFEDFNWANAQSSQELRNELGHI